MTNEYDLLDEEELREECIILSDALDQAINEGIGGAQGNLGYTPMASEKPQGKCVKGYVRKPLQTTTKQ